MVNGVGAGSGISPWMKCRSEAQIPQAATFTTTSPGPGTGSGIASTDTGRPGPRNLPALTERECSGSQLRSEEKDEVLR